MIRLIGGGKNLGGYFIKDPFESLLSRCINIET
jgi:hypothetical protein